jgi:hypothetical protein
VTKKKERKKKLVVVSRVEVEGKLLPHQVGDNPNA